jgi:hypothetical protein
MNRIHDDTMPPDLSARLARLREAAAALQPPAYVETQLNARLFAPPAASAAEAPPPIEPRGAPARTTLMQRWAAWIAWPISVSAAAGLVSWMVYTNPAVAPEPLGPVPASSPGLESRESDAVATPFLALTSLDNIRSGARNEVVSASVPRATLAEFGLPVSPLRAAEPIDAEFLVGANGGVLAVRFVDTGWTPANRNQP